MGKASAFRRVGWGVADQILYSLTNFALTIAVASQVRPADFGRFATLLVASQLVLVISRGLATDPLQTRHSGLRRSKDGTAVSAALGTVLAFGLTIAAGLAALSQVVPPTMSASLLIFALVMPGLLVQDGIRHAAFAIGRPKIALANDALWAVIQISAIVWLGRVDQASVPNLVAAWGGAASICALVGLSQLRVLPKMRATAYWLRKHSDLWRYYVPENALLNGTNLAIVVLIAIVSSLDTTAAIRGAVALFGPLNVLSLGLRAALVPEFARILETSGPNRLYRVTIVLAIVLGAAGALWGTLCSFVPDRWGQILIGDTWALAEPILPLMTVDAAASLFAVGVFIGMRSLGESRRGATARFTMAVPRLTLSVIGAARSGAAGAAWGFAILAPAQIAVWTFQLRRAVATANWSG